MRSGVLRCRAADLWPWISAFSAADVERHIKRTSDWRRASSSSTPAHPWLRRRCQEVLELLPEDWLEESPSGVSKLKSSFKNKVAGVVIRLGRDGRDWRSGRGWPPCTCPAPLRFCVSLRCPLTRATRQATLGKLNPRVGRTFQRHEPSIASGPQPPRRPGAPSAPRNSSAFTDNRQDASLQAGHFNDFVQVGLLRSALYRADAAAGPAASPRGARSKGRRARPPDRALRAGPKRPSTRLAPRPIEHYEISSVTACIATFNAAGGSRRQTWSKPACSRSATSPCLNSAATRRSGPGSIPPSPKRPRSSDSLSRKCSSISFDGASRSRSTTSMRSGRASSSSDQANT